jgi:hypothetical protein
VSEGAAAIVAARNEAATIRETVKALWLVRGVDRVVVVDDGSNDGTAEAAAEAGAEVLRADGHSKGLALDVALGKVDARIFLLVDADTGVTAEGSAPLLAAVMGGDADLAIGRLPQQAGGGFGLVKDMAGWLIRRACGFEAAAPMSGQRAATGEVLQACRPLAGGFGVEPAMTTDAVRLGYSVVEIDVEMSHRATGRSLSGFAHRGRQGIHVLAAMIPRLFRLR